MTGREIRIGTQLGKYRLILHLGEGGAGVVYAAEDLVLTRRVALKILSGDAARQPGIAERFLLEARAAARLNHPNVVAVHDIGHQDEVSYIVMELVEGVSAQTILDERGALPWPQATRIIAEVCRGLAAAHAAGLIHRDIKPANILLGHNGSVKLSDFGLAKAPQLVPGHVTEHGAILGTPHYMSPEQCAGDRIDARADVYALGGAYHALLTGRPPYEEPNSVTVMFAHCTGAVPDPRRLVPALPDTCAAVVMKAMAKERADRFRSSQEMLTALADVLAAVPAETAVAMPAPPTPAPVLTDTGMTEQPLMLTSRTQIAPPRRWRFVPVGAALAVVTLVVVGVIVVASTFFRSPSSEPSPQPSPVVQPAAFPDGQRITLVPRPPWAKHQGAAHGLAFGGRRFASVGADKLARVWDLDSPQAPAQLFVHPHEVHCVALSPDGKWLATGNRDAAFVSLWDVDTGKELGTIGDASGPWSLAFHPSAKRLAIGSGNRLQLIELDDAGKEIKRRNLTGESLYAVTGIAFTPDGRHLGATTLKPGAFWLDGATLLELNFLRNADRVELFAGLAFSADSKVMAFVKKIERTVDREYAIHEMFFWEPQTGQPPRFVTTETHGAVISAMAFAPGGRQIAHGGTFGGPIKLHDLESGQTLSFPADVLGNVTGLAFSPDGRLLAATCSDGSVLGWDVVRAGLDPSGDGHVKHDRTVP
jgi:serine/threonine protein kinase